MKQIAPLENSGKPNSFESNIIKALADKCSVHNLFAAILFIFIFNFCIGCAFDSGDKVKEEAFLIQFINKILNSESDWIEMIGDRQQKDVKNDVLAIKDQMSSEYTVHFLDADKHYVVYRVQFRSGLNINVEIYTAGRDCRVLSCAPVVVVPRSGSGTNNPEAQQQ